MKILQTLFMSMKLTKSTLALLFTIVSGTFVYSQEELNSIGTIETDRPDATEASSTVPKNHLQFETGAFFETFEKNQIKTESFTYNTMLVRYGLSDNFELRLGWDFREEITYLNSQKMGDIASGLSPLLLGMKVYITEEKGWIPEVSLIGHIFLPFTASTDYRPETTGIDFRFSLSHTLSEKSSLGYNIGMAWGEDSPEASYIYTLAYGYSITDTFGAYVELYGDLPEDNRANHYWDAGLTYLISNNFQLDVSFGTSITEGQDLLLSAGASFRLPMTKNN